MKKILFSLLLLCTVSVFAASPSKIPSITIGERVFTDLDNLIELVAATNANTFATFRKAIDGTSGYVVTAGKTFKVHAVRMTDINITTGLAATIGYADDDAGFSSVGAPTTPIYYAGDVAILPFAGVNGLATEMGNLGYAVKFNIPAGKLPFAKFGSSSPNTIWIYGFEE